MHDVFTFPPVVYADRFVLSNKAKFPNFNQQMERKRQSKNSLLENLKRYEMLGESIPEKFGFVKTFIQNQTLDESDANVDEFEAVLKNPQYVGTLGLKPADIKTTLKVLDQFES